MINIYKTMKQILHNCNKNITEGTIWFKKENFSGKMLIFDKLHKISFIGLLLNLQKCIRFCGSQSAALIHHYSAIIYIMNICKNI
jgi:hypothetical protein